MPSSCVPVSLASLLNLQQQGSCRQVCESAVCCRRRHIYFPFGCTWALRALPLPRRDADASVPFDMGFGITIGTEPSFTCEYFMATLRSNV